MRRSGGLALLAALSAMACVGPTLEVGERVVLAADAGEELDAGELDGGDGAVRLRDGSFGDRDLHLEERRACRDDRDCTLNFYRDHCGPVRFVCVECTDDRHCESGNCVEPEGYCRSPEKPRDDDDPP